MGKAPEPFYDPLEFAVQEAHKRGLELHAWFNPYRARHAAARSPVAPGHISRTKPHLVRQYGSSLWLDPGEKEVQQYSLAVILDVVKRYDVDGIHIDDYFYPYKEKDGAGRELEFPDEASWRQFGAGGPLGRDDWRRENVNTFVHRLYDSVQKVKPWVKVGVSPFGIWRPGYPAQIQGLDAYDKLFADSRKWLVNGWVDYLAPQLYWAIEPPAQSFPVLLHWWAAQNEKNRVIAPGIDSTKVGRRWPAEEIVKQIELARKEPGAGGHIHWNVRALLRNPALAGTLQRSVYSEPALSPALGRVQNIPSSKPRLRVRGSGSSAEVSWSAPAGQQKPRLWVVQTKKGGDWDMRILSGSRSSCRVGSPDIIAVTPVTRAGHLGDAAVLQRSP
jgi:uncharacterized lipoprotein YddW (UPF0748 family)